jgi:hypothetical protein
VADETLKSLADEVIRLSKLELNEDTIRELGYSDVRHLPSRGWCGVYRFMFTTAIVCGLDQIGYATRFCYHHWLEASEALRSWDGMGDPPGNWIKEKPGDRHGPGSPDYIPVREDGSKSESA